MWQPPSTLLILLDHFFCLFFQTQFFFVTALAVLELSVQSRLTSHSRDPPNFAPQPAPSLAGLGLNARGTATQVSQELAPIGASDTLYMRLVTPPE